MKTDTSCKIPFCNRSVGDKQHRRGGACPLCCCEDGSDRRTSLWPIFQSFWIQLKEYAAACSDMSTAYRNRWDRTKHCFFSPMRDGQIDKDWWFIINCCSSQPSRRNLGERLTAAGQLAIPNQENYSRRSFLNICLKENEMLWQSVRYFFNVRMGSGLVFLLHADAVTLAL